MTYLTLEANGTERTLAAWGIALSSLSVRHVSLNPDVLRFKIPTANYSAAPGFAFETRAILRVGRASADGADDSFTDGTVAFIGYCLAAHHELSGESAAVHYTFVNAWYYLEQTLYQQKRATIPTTYPALNYQYTTEVTLFMTLGSLNEFVKLTNGQQIQAVLQFLLDHPPVADAAPFIIGTIDPALDLPLFETQEVSCAAAVLKCLEPSPETTVIFDYTTTAGGTPRPTLHVRKRSNLTPVALALHAADHQSTSIRPLPDLIARSVLIFYRVTASINSIPFVTYVLDKFGPGGAGTYGSGDPDRGPRVLIQTFDLSGGTRNDVSCFLDVRSCNANSTDAAARLAWWQTQTERLRNSELVEVVSASIADAEVTAAFAHNGFSEGQAVNLAAYPLEVLKSEIQGWMVAPGGAAIIGVSAVVRAKATVSFRKRISPGHAWNEEQPQELQLSAAITLTNGPGGLHVKTEISGGDILPSDVARQVYESLATLQYEGEHVLIEPSPTGRVSLANTLNLTGGRPEWSSMKAQIQSVTTHYGLGHTAIAFGPARHLSAGDIISICLFNRTRRIKEGADVRVTGQPG